MISVHMMTLRLLPSHAFLTRAVEGQHLKGIASCGVLVLQMERLEILLTSQALYISEGR